MPSSYLVVKSLHILAVITWLSCFAGDLWVLSWLREPELRQRWRDSGGRLGQLALALVWLLGLVAMTMAGWQTFLWMRLKLLLVFVLSGLHGATSARIRRGKAPLPQLCWAVAGAVCTIVFLVVIKPVPVFR